MKVTQGQILARGLTNCCPNCGGRTLFQAERRFQLNRACPVCGLKLEKDDGFFLGAMSLNYGITLVGFLTPVGILWYAGKLGETTAVVLLLTLSVVMPVLLYRSSRSWQLMLYYFFLPQHLPANRTGRGSGDENV